MRDQKRMASVQTTNHQDEWQQKCPKWVTLRTYNNIVQPYSTNEISFYSNSHYMQQKCKYAIVKSTVSIVIP